MKKQKKVKKLIKNASATDEFSCGHNMYISPQQHLAMSRTALGLAPYIPSRQIRKDRRGMTYPRVMAQTEAYSRKDGVSPLHDQTQAVENALF